MPINRGFEGTYLGTQKKEARAEKLQIFFWVALVVILVIVFYLFKKRKLGALLNKLKIWENKSFNFVINSLLKPSRIFWVTVFVSILIYFNTKNNLQNVLLFVVAMIVLWNTREIYLKNKDKK